MTRSPWSFISFLFCTSLLLASVYALDRRWGKIPALGPFLSPFRGIWLQPDDRIRDAETTLSIPGLRSTVKVLLDRNRIYHVFAENDHDMYLAQGYLTAKDRLWQMDFVSRIAAGRLSEVVGESGLETDLLFTKLGLADAAKASVDVMMQDEPTREALLAYTQGVNAYIRELTPERYPFEFRLLGYAPETWSPQRAGYLLKFMSYMLSGNTKDLQATRSRAQLTGEEFAELFDIAKLITDPIVPKGTSWAFKSNMPSTPDKEFEPDLKKLPLFPVPPAGNGSNNWGIQRQKSITAMPILANDVHLNYTLPALWYQIQLVSPNQQVSGFTIPGAPGIIIGFNKNFAWGVTNGYDDVMDWYQLRFKDDSRTEYFFNGEWRPVITSEAHIQVRDRGVRRILQRKTHFGPIVYEEPETPKATNIPRGLAMRWTALDPSNEIKAFLRLNRAKTVQECGEITQGFHNPGQNFLCADNSGQLAMFHAGETPLRYKNQGRFINDGSVSEQQWKGQVLHENMPSVINPPSNFVSSANQPPTDDAYPFYLGAQFEPQFRATRINEMLRLHDGFSAQDMMNMQGDATSVVPRTILPILIKQIESAQLSGLELEAFERLKTWDFRFLPESIAASIFDRWFQELEKRTWSELFPDSTNYLYPSPHKLVQLIVEDSKSKWFDRRSTPEKETLATVALASFHDAIDEMQKKMGSRIERWRWSNYQPTSFPHVAKIPGLGNTVDDVRGTRWSIFANTGSHGPVAKFVVALGAQPRAWGIYPGGQSGNPTSRFYDNWLERWAKNEYLEFIIPSDAQDIDDKIIQVVTMEAE